ncbi:hypothetical protein DQ04_02441000 [Trypanosoma grayi]|uniref:hypothetical protein n=1 Tax=Trypanosoma grayi TaxID=71804 RepID=UPI0004F4AD60|nr:hypothetical protein DQ04_02441000 [Trypanosoma grayi]KEG11611.1 hypothetical protein DQ04_02441000 [Trypanosoma grayi]
MALARAITASYDALRTQQQGPSVVSFAAAADGNSEEALLSPLELLSAFTSALDAMSDTDDDVRRAALVVLRVILRPPCGSQRGGVTCDLDRTRAVLSVVNVTLTHAMVSVRRSGVELLQLILQVSPRGVRAVLRESSVWVKMASRVSSVVMQGGGSSNTGNTTAGTAPAMKMIHVVPELLETMLRHRTDVLDNSSGEEVQQDEVKTEEVGNDDGTGGGDAATGAAPEEILALFEECAPRWSMAWKELMELRAALFRDAERVQRATAMARTFACMALYLREERLLKRSHAQLIRQLFTAKVPFTMHELISPTTTAAAAAAASAEGAGSGGSSNKARVELANAIADACLPVAATDEDAWRVLRDFLSIVLRGAKDAASSAHAGGDSKRAVQLLGPLRTLRTAVVRFPAKLLPRLLFLAPPLLQVVTRSASSISSSSADATAWVTVLLATADVLAVLLASQAATASPHGVRFLSEAVLAVPRLLFSLRSHEDAAVVDRVVLAFLQPLWRVASTGHPLLHSSASAGGDAATQLRLSLPSLFELRVPNEEKSGEYITLEGVLCRCSDRTVELAVHVLFYLGGEVPCTRMGSISGSERAAPLAFPALTSTLPC